MMYIGAAVQMLLARNAEEKVGGSGRKLSEIQIGDKEGELVQKWPNFKIRGHQNMQHPPPTPLPAQSALLYRYPWGAVCTLSYYN